MCACINRLIVIRDLWIIVFARGRGEIVANTNICVEVVSVWIISEFD